MIYSKVLYYCILLLLLLSSSSSFFFFFFFFFLLLLLLFFSFYLLSTGQNKYKYIVFIVISIYYLSIQYLFIYFTEFSFFSVLPQSNWYNIISVECTVFVA